MRFTQAQTAAITSRDKALLISAGAGSGKTAVLSERVISRLNEGVRLTQLVVLTFTDAAAQEMKERIRKKIAASVEAGHLESSHLDDLKSAHIQTFDSFAFYLVQKFGHFIGLPPHLQLMDSIVYTYTKKEALDRILETYYENEDARFLALIEDVVIKHDRSLKEKIIALYDALELFHDGSQVIAEWLEKGSEEATFERLFKTYEQALQTEVSDLKAALEHHRFTYDNEAVDTFVSLIQDWLDRFAHKSYAELHALSLNRPKAPTFSKPIKEAMGDTESQRFEPFYKALKDRVSSHVLKPASHSLSVWSERYHLKMSHLPILLEITQALKEAMTAAMTETHRYSYQAIAMMALRLVQTVPYVQNSLRESVLEIMVDEYQDTSGLQNALIEAMQAQTTFMVGDMKQSIYRFRHADVTIFQEKQNNFTAGQGGVCLTLAQNFRSNAGVINDLNRLFETLFEPRFGGLVYDQTHQLEAANDVYKQHDRVVKEGLKLVTFDSHGDDGQAIKKDQRRFEIALIAQDILERLKTDQTLDKEGLRPIRYQDITILVDRRTHFQAFAEIFEAKGIPLRVLKSESLAQTELFLVLHNLIEWCIQIAQGITESAYVKRSFYSVMRSFLGRVEDDVLLRVLHDFDARGVTAFYEATDARVRSFSHDVRSLASSVFDRPLEEALRDLLETLDVYASLVYLKDTQAQQARLDYLLVEARRLGAEGLNLRSFQTYLQTAKDHEIDMAYAPLKDDRMNAVTLMTIHGSKGLEFPHLYLAHLDNAIRFDHSGDLVFDRDIGLLWPIMIDRLQTYDFTDRLKKDREREAQIGESLRLLYVALTRAKETIFMALPTEKSSRLLTKKTAKSLADFIRLSHFEPDQTVAYDETIIPPMQVKATADRVTTQASKKMYLPPLKPAVVQHQKRFSREEKVLLSPEILKAMRLGDELHQLLERIDFLHQPLSQIAVVTHNAHHQALLEAFFTQPQWQTWSVKEVYQEFAFVLDEGDTMRQGFIDCLLACDDRYVIIDYKLKSIDKTVYYDQVRGYMAYIKKRLKKPVEGYLYSLLEQRFLKVDVDES